MKASKPRHGGIKPRGLHIAVLCRNGPRHRITKGPVVQACANREECGIARMAPVNAEEGESNDPRTESRL